MYIVQYNWRKIDTVKVSERKGWKENILVRVLDTSMGIKYRKVYDPRPGPTLAKKVVKFRLKQRNIPGHCTVDWFEKVREEGHEATYRIRAQKWLTRIWFSINKDLIISSWNTANASEKWRKVFCSFGVFFPTLLSLWHRNFSLDF